VSACATGARDPAPIQRGAPGSATCSGPVTVARGDTLYAIARRCGVTVDAMAEANGLRAPYALTAGQRLDLPRPSTYTVRRGDNLYRIALAHGMSTEEMARLNGMRAPYTIFPGQELTVRGQARTVARTPRRDTAPGPRQNAGTVSPPPPPPAPVATQVAFRWPVDGPVVTRFREGEGRMDGVRIAAPIGTPVRAAADGEVVYANNEIQGYGELVLIRHADRLTTAYGLNSVIRVEVGQQVRAGDHIADTGSSEANGDGVLHFEIRRNVSPVDPLTLLPRRGETGS
ncbi:MAG: LysM peptidoglycan-binding domain-containing protein, partial [Oceanicaulis sp.]